MSARGRARTVTPGFRVSARLGADSVQVSGEVYTWTAGRTERDIVSRFVDYWPVDEVECLADAMEIVAESLLRMASLERGDGGPRPHTQPLF